MVNAGTETINNGLLGDNTRSSRLKLIDRPHELVIQAKDGLIDMHADLRESVLVRGFRNSLDSVVSSIVYLRDNPDLSTFERTKVQDDILKNIGNLATSKLLGEVKVFDEQKMMRLTGLPRYFCEQALDSLEQTIPEIGPLDGTQEIFDKAYNRLFAKIVNNDGTRVAGTTGTAGRTPDAIPPTPDPESEPNDTGDPSRNKKRRLKLPSFKGKPKEDDETVLPPVDDIDLTKLKEVDADLDATVRTKRGLSCGALLLTIFLCSTCLIGSGYAVHRVGAIPAVREKVNEYQTSQVVLGRSGGDYIPNLFGNLGDDEKSIASNPLLQSQFLTRLSISNGIIAGDPRLLDTVPEPIDTFSALDLANLLSSMAGSLGDGYGLTAWMNFSAHKSVIATLSANDPSLEQRLAGTLPDLKVGEEDVNGVDAYNNLINNWNFWKGHLRLVVNEFGSFDVSLNITDSLKKAMYDNGLIETMNATDEEIYQAYYKDTESAVLNFSAYYQEFLKSER